jgi:hypothetical protein
LSIVGDSWKRPLRRWRLRARVAGDAWGARREEWSVERDIERGISGTGPVLLGPWTGEVGYELLYWVPFLRWLVAAYRPSPHRLVAMSRGGTASWYADIAPAYVDVFDVLAPDDFGRRARARVNEAGTSKQYGLSALDCELVDGIASQIGAAVQVLHPSLMYRLFRAFWAGQESMSFLERHLRFSRVAAPAHVDLAPLPREYVAVKFYTARSLPFQPSICAALRSVVSSLAAHVPVVLLDSAVRVDEHQDFTFDDLPNVTSARPLMQPSTNLGAQTQIIAGARAFVGTCGSVAWLAPLLGVDTLAVLADAGFLHAHLHVARRAFHRLAGAGAFSTCDVGALAKLGLTIARPEGRPLE